MPRPAHNPLEKQIQAVRATLQRLDRELRGLVPAMAKAAKSTGTAPPRRKLQLSPERRRALKIHGQYLGHIRLLEPAQKARVKAAKAKGGYRAAIALAKRLGNR